MSAIDARLGETDKGVVFRGSRPCTATTASCTRCPKRPAMLLTADMDGDGRANFSRALTGDFTLVTGDFIL